MRHAALLVPTLMCAYQGAKLAGINPKWLERNSGYSFAVSKEEVCMAAPAIQVFDPTTSQLVWSPDSRVLLSLGHRESETPNLPSFRILAWNSVTRKVSSPVSEATSGNFSGWLGGKGHVFAAEVSSAWQENGIAHFGDKQVLFDPVTGASTVIGSTTGTEADTQLETLSVDCNPVKPVAAVTHQLLSTGKPQTPPPAWVQFFTISGPTGISFKLVGKENFVWLPDGRPGVRSMTKPESNGTAILSTWEVDPSSGKRNLIESKPLVYEGFMGTQSESTKNVLTVVDSPSQVQMKNQRIIGHASWIQYTNSPISSGLVAVGSSDEAISPDGKWLSYRLDGSIFVRPLVKVDPNAYALAYRAAAMNRTKQVALGLVMYASDYDGDWVQGNDWADKVYPYLKDSTLTDGFVLTLNGTTIPAGQEGSTIVGYMPVPGGRLNAFGDGHVRFDPEP